MNTASELWLCSECLGIADAREWGGTDSTAVCPRCSFEHRDDETTFVMAGTELELARKARSLREEE